MREINFKKFSISKIFEPKLAYFVLATFLVSLLYFKGVGLIISLVLAFFLKISLDEEIHKDFIKKTYYIFSIVSLAFICFILSQTDLTNEIIHPIITFVFLVSMISVLGVSPFHSTLSGILEKKSTILRDETWKISFFLFAQSLTSILLFILLEREKREFQLNEMMEYFLLFTVIYCLLKSNFQKNTEKSIIWVWQAYFNLSSFYFFKTGTFHYIYNCSGILVLTILGLYLSKRKDDSIFNRIIFLFFSYVFFCGPFTNCFYLFNDITKSNVIVISFYTKIILIYLPVLSFFNFFSHLVEFKFEKHKALSFGKQRKTFFDIVSLILIFAIIIAVGFDFFQK